MRKASLSTFVAGLLLYPFGFYFTMDVYARAFLSHGGGGIDRAKRDWLIGRTLSVLAVVLLVISVILAFLTPPSRERKRTWWAVPATAIAIVIVYFDWLGIGFGF
jgi:uncharacterized BrkB/YihY/UPF0761 family membrane protein